MGKSDNTYLQIMLTLPCPADSRSLGVDRAMRWEELEFLNDLVEQSLSASNTLYNDLSEQQTCIIKHNNNV